MALRARNPSPSGRASLNLQSTCHGPRPSVMVRPWNAGNYLRTWKLVRFRHIKLAFCIWDYHETRRARAHIARCHHGSGNNNAASLLRLLRFKVSNRQGLAK